MDNLRKNSSRQYALVLNENLRRLSHIMSAILVSFGTIWYQNTKFKHNCGDKMAFSPQN